MESTDMKNHLGQATRMLPKGRATYFQRCYYKSSPVYTCRIYRNSYQSMVQKQVRRSPTQILAIISQILPSIHMDIRPGLGTLFI